MPSSSTTSRRVSHCRSCASPPKGSKIASGSWDKTVIIWDAATGDKVSELEGHSEGVTSVAWSPNPGNVLRVEIHQNGSNNPLGVNGSSSDCFSRKLESQTLDDHRLQAETFIRPSGVFFAESSELDGG